MRGGADETEQLPEVPGLVPPSAAFSSEREIKISRACALRESWLAGPPSSPWDRGRADAASFREGVPVRGPVEGRGLGATGEQCQEQEHQEHYAYFQSIGAQRP
jgi:hypothetical protein